ncbi:Heat shock protein hslJ [Leminorella richardii]|uniref:Heat shock protein hslJ n=1 Tax=Leminorella richardii TaxID=158841 RepID=A0A2X4ULH3_9GAMM|nr:heat shock protein HslJ [Leminorella richardii]SQI40776.1 Heat shock protein hslJ [Leminorella richardii]
MKTLYPLLFALTVLTGCSTNSPSSVMEKDLMHHRFILTSADGVAIKDTSKQQRPLDIEFGENMHISGAMCNSFMGKGTLKGGVLSAPQLASTRMACLNEQLNKLDKTVADMFNEGVQVNLDGEMLTLSTSSHTLTYRRMDWVR